MAYFGLVPGEQSSGETIRRGGITKTGNAHARRFASQAVKLLTELGTRAGRRRLGLPNEGAHRSS
jgi:transposase